MFWPVERLSAFQGGIFNVVCELADYRKYTFLLDAFVGQADSGHKECGEAKTFQYTSLLKNQSFKKKGLAQDMTNQHNKTFCDIVSDFGEKVKWCWPIVLFLCPFFMLQRIPLGGIDRQICFIILCCFALKTARHFSLCQILSSLLFKLFGRIHSVYP